MNNLIGIHLSAYCSNWLENLTSHIKTAASQGYDLVELPLFDARIFETEKYLPVIDSLGLSTTACNSIPGDADLGSTDESIRLKGIDYLKRAIERSKKIHALSLNGVMYEPWGSHDPYTEENREALMKSLGEIDAWLGDDNFKVNLEVINRFEGKRLNTIDDALALLDGIDSKHIGIHIDTFHMNIEELDIKASIRKAARRLGHVHFCENDRSAIGRGHIDFPGVTDVLKEIGWTGPIVVESYIDNTGDIAPDVPVNRKADMTNNEMNRQSISYIRKLLNER